MNHRVLAMTWIGAGLLIGAMGFLSIREGSFGGLLIVLLLVFILMETMRRSGSWGRSWDMEKALRSIQEAKSVEIAWREICRSLEHLRFDYGKLQIEFNNSAPLYQWTGKYQHDAENSGFLKIDIPIHLVGSGAEGILTAAKNINREPILNEALEWISSMQKMGKK
jgi:hypothetical protein